MFTHLSEEFMGIRDAVFGPGQPCIHCGLGYNQHTKDCPVPAQQEELLLARQIELGKKVREAIEAKADFTLGKLLMELTSK